MGMNLFPKDQECWCEADVLWDPEDVSFAAFGMFLHLAVLEVLIEEKHRHHC